MGIQLPLPKGHSPPPNIRPISVAAKWLRGSRCHLVWSIGLGLATLCWMNEAGTWHEGRPEPRRLCVRWGPRTPPSKGGGAPPRFSAHFYCGQTVGCIKMPVGMDVGLSLGDFVLDGEPVPSPTRGRSPPIFGQCLSWPTLVYCGQMAGWMKTPLGTEVDLGSGHVVLDGVPAPAKGAQHPLFSVHVYCGHGRPSQLLLSSC